MRVLHSRFYILDSRKCQAALSLVFLIGGIAVLVGISLASLVLSFINATYGFQDAETALGAASAGASDAFLRLVRNKDFAAGTPYAVTVGAQTANVTVTQAGSQATILSTATVGNRQRKVQAVVGIDSLTGQVSLVSWQLAL